MARTSFLLLAAVGLLAALALALVPFEAHLATQARDGSRMELTVGVRCRAPIVDGLDPAVPGDQGAPRPCQGRARWRLGAGAALAGIGGASLAAGLRRPLRGGQPGGGDAAPSGRSHRRRRVVRAGQPKRR